MALEAVRTVTGRVPKLNVSVGLDPELYQAAVNTAQRRNVPLTVLLRELITRSLAEQPADCKPGAEPGR